MKELLEIVIKSLVDNKEAVSINQVDGQTSIILEVTVDQADMGKVIGKQGRLAKAIRTIIKAIATKENKRVSVEFIG